MDTTEISKIVFKGPEDAIKRYRGEAVSQLQILDNFMNFQNLKQCRRLVTLASGVIIACTKVYGLRIAEILVPRPLVEQGRTIIIQQVNQYLLLIYGNQEEYIDVAYGKDSPVFVVENVNCTAGSGTITAVDLNRIYGTFTMCWEAMVYGATSHAFASISSAIERHYTRLYKKQEIVSSGLIAFTPEISDADHRSSLDTWPLSDTGAQGYSRAGGQEWTKTLGFFNVTAFSFYTDLPQLGAMKWAVSASYKNTVIEWLGYDYFPQSGFCREICKQATCDVGTSWIDVHIGFDVWTQINSETGKEEYYVGLMADAESFFTIWKYEESINEMVLQYQYASTVRDDYFEESFHPLRHVRVVGYGHNSDGQDIVYWATPGYYSGYYMEYPFDGTVTLYDSTGVLVAAVWNPIFRTLHTVYEGVSSTEEPTVETQTRRGTESNYNNSPWNKSCMCYGYYQYHACAPCEGGTVTKSGKVYAPLYSGKCNFDTTGRDFFSGDLTVGQVSTETESEYGSFTIDGTSFSKGSRMAETNGNLYIYVRETTPKGGTSCVFNVQSYAYPSGNSRCYPYDQREYAFLGAVFSPEGAIAYSYTYAEYLEVPHPTSPGSAELPNTICELQDYVAPILEGGDEKAFIDTAFPYDHLWRAILLEGTGRISDASNALIITPREGAVIYQSEDGILTLMGGDFSTTEIGEYERGFFKQVEIATEQEIEI